MLQENGTLKIRVVIETLLQLHLLMELIEQMLID